MFKTGIMEEFKTIVDVYEKSGGDPDIFNNSDVTSLVVSGNRVLAKNTSQGIHVETNELDNGVEVFLEVEDNIQLEKPVHMCFGLVHKTGEQRIISHYNIGNNTHISFLAHCVFPKAVNITHKMESDMTIGSYSRVSYNEVHYHGPEGGITVVPKSTVTLEKGSRYNAEFKLVEGAVGSFDLDYTVIAGEKSIAELNTKLYGKKRDSIKIKESIFLNGNHSRGLAKTRIVNKDYSKSEVLGEVIGNGKYSRGHVDCTEILEGEHAEASAVPLVRVTNPSAKVTHEAAIGSVDKNQVETLMARGLTEGEAVDVIIKGLLK